MEYRCILIHLKKKNSEWRIVVQLLQAMHFITLNDYKNATEQNPKNRYFFFQNMKKTVLTVFFFFLRKKCMQNSEGTAT